MKIWRSCTLVGAVSYQLSATRAQLMDACAAVLVLFGLGRRGKEGREIKGEKSHMQGCIFLKNFFLCLPLPDQNKRKLEEKTHCDRETNENKQAHYFWEQNKQLGTTRPQKNPIFNVNLHFHILLPLLGYKNTVFLNKTSRNKKWCENIGTPGLTTTAGKTIDHAQEVCFSMV